MDELSDAIAALSEEDRQGFSDYCREAERVLEETSSVFAWLADGATATSPIADMESDELQVLIESVPRARGVSSWATLEVGGEEELVGATLESPAWRSESVREVWNLLAMELAAERDVRERDGRDLDDAVTEGLGIHVVGDATVEPGYVDDADET